MTSSWQLVTGGAKQIKYEFSNTRQETSTITSAVSGTVLGISAFLETSLTSLASSEAEEGNNFCLAAADDG